MSCAGSFNSADHSDDTPAAHAGPPSSSSEIKTMTRTEPAGKLLGHVGMEPVLVVNLALKFDSLHDWHEQSIRHHPRSKQLATGQWRFTVESRQLRAKAFLILTVNCELWGARTVSDGQPTQISPDIR